MAKFLSTFTSTAHVKAFPRITVDKMPLRNLGGWIFKSYNRLNIGIPIGFSQYFFHNQNSRI
jgi:hypothetical protein